MSTNTTRLGLVKPAGSENYDVGVFNANADRVDSTIGRVVCTSATRPAASARFTGMAILETDTGNQLTFDGVDWFHEGVPVITNLAQILRPYPGQRAYLTTDNTFYRRNAANTAWLAVESGAAGTDAATRHEAQYSAATAQSIPNAADTRILFGTANRVSNLVTTGTSGAGTTFTLNRTGLWTVSTTIRFFGSADGGERYIALFANTTGSALHSAASQQIEANKGPVTLFTSVSTQIAAGSVIMVNAYQNSGGAVTLDNGGGGAWVRINLSWIRG